MIETFRDLRQWFHERLEHALRRRAVTAEPETQAYLVELLAALRVAPAEVPLAMQLLEARVATGHDRLRRFRALGDEALCLSGLFSDHLERLGVSPGYVQTLGGGAYESAGVLAIHGHPESGAPVVYRELSAKFQAFADVLEEVRESTVLRTPQDIVRLYDKWRRTGSPVLAERLTAEGVYPANGSRGPTLH